MFSLDYQLLTAMDKLTNEQLKQHGLLRTPWGEYLPYNPEPEQHDLLHHQLDLYSNTPSSANRLPGDNPESTL